MTSELLARARSMDEDVAETAAGEWERACESYNDHIKEIGPELPRAVRTLLDRFYLHDAKVLTMAWDESPFFSVFLQLQSKDLIELRYRLVKPLQVIHHVPRPQDGPPLRWWLYDEIAVVQDAPFPVFSHSILFTGGWEVCLFFVSVRTKRLVKLLFPPEGVDAAKEKDLEVELEGLIYKSA
jgi:hypothetical protein